MLDMFLQMLLIAVAIQMVLDWFFKIKLVRNIVDIEGSSVFFKGSELKPLVAYGVSMICVAGMDFKFLQAFQETEKVISGTFIWTDRALAAGIIAQGAKGVTNMWKKVDLGRKELKNSVEKKNGEEKKE